jgi:hypothetical protein
MGCREKKSRGGGGGLWKTGSSSFKGPVRGERETSGEGAMGQVGGGGGGGGARINF